MIDFRGFAKAFARRFQSVILICLMIIPVIFIPGCQDNEKTPHSQVQSTYYPLTAYRDHENGNLVVTSGRSSRGIRLVTAGEYGVLDMDGMYPDDMIPAFINELAQLGFNSIRMFLVYREPQQWTLYVQ